MGTRKPLPLEKINLVKGVSKAEMPQLISFMNGVFKKNFRKLLPKIYCNNNYLENHYVIKEKGKFIANVASIPMQFKLYENSLTGRGIGMVSVDKKCRNKGYMSTLLTRAIEDAKKEGVDFMVLSGNRQRYEPFGFTPAGYRYEFTLTDYVCKHVKAPNRFRFVKLKKDSTQIGKIKEIYRQLPIRYERREDDFFDILQSWKTGNGIYAVYEKEELCGYLIYTWGKVREIVSLKSVKEVCLDFRKQKGAKRFVLFPDDAIAVGEMANCCEKMKMVYANSFKILNFENCVKLLLQAECRQKNLCDFETVIKAADETFCVSVKQGRANVYACQSKPDYVWTEKEAVSYLFSPLFAQMSPLPFCLPLYIKESDDV